MTTYPQDRQNTGFAIRFIKALMRSDAITEIGLEAVMLCIIVASTEDRLRYKKPPSFWRAQLLRHLGKGSPKALIRIRQAAIDAGLLVHVPGTKTKPGLYWVAVPSWLEADKMPFRKRNGKQEWRSENGTEREDSVPKTERQTERQTERILLPSYKPIYKTPKAKRRFVPPSLEEVQAYCKERRNKVDPERFMDHYTANGWTQGRNKPLKDWQAAVRTWEKNSFNQPPASQPAAEPPEYRPIKPLPPMPPRSAKVSP